MNGSRLVELRSKFNMTQKELADKLNLSPKAISFYELEQRDPSNDCLIQIAQYFHVTSDYLLGLSDTPQATSAPLPPAERHLLTLFRTLNAEGQEVAVNVLNGITQQAQYKKSSAAKPIQKQA